MMTIRRRNDTKGGSWIVDASINGRRKRLTFRGSTTPHELRVLEAGLVAELASMPKKLKKYTGGRIPGFASLRSFPCPEPQQMAKRLMARVKTGAQSRGIRCLLTENDILDIIERSEGKCEVSGVPFVYGVAAGRRVNPYSPSVDRIISSGHYAPDNVRLVLYWVNMALNEFGDECFFHIVQSTAEQIRTVAKIQGAK